MTEVFEMIMLICFGLSWPTSILKSWRARTSRGKSLLFMIFIEIGYVSGIISKLMADNISYVLIFYFINLVMVAIDISLYFRNRKLDQKAGQKQ